MGSVVESQRVETGVAGAAKAPVVGAWYLMQKTELHQFDSPLDAGIASYVITLSKNGIETYESCQGGPGHCFPEPTVRFHGGHHEGFRALSVAAAHGLPIAELRRVWSIVDGEPVGPTWEMTFKRPCNST